MKILLSALVVLLALLAAGCASTVSAPGNKLQPPAVRLMVPAKRLADVAPGEDIFDDDTACSLAYARETAKLTMLQSWAAQVTRN